MRYRRTVAVPRPRPGARQTTEQQADRLAGHQPRRAGRLRRRNRGRALPPAARRDPAELRLVGFDRVAWAAPHRRCAATATPKRTPRARRTIRPGQRRTRSPRRRSSSRPTQADCKRRATATGSDCSRRSRPPARSTPPGAVGDQQLTYLGYSYGTLPGAVYAQLFPGDVRAMVLDGDVDPTAGELERAPRARPPGTAAPHDRAGSDLCMLTPHGRPGGDCARGRRSTRYRVYPNDSPQGEAGGAGRRGRPEPERGMVGET